MWIKSVEYRAWRAIIDHGHPICPEWRRSFEVFLRDMGPRPSPKHQLGRIDKASAFSKANCQWTTHTGVCRRSLRNRLLEFNGKKMCMAQWADDLGLAYSTLANRLNVLGWTVEKALSTPVDPKLARTRRKKAVVQV